MSAALKVGLILLGFAVLMGLIALLPSTADYPLPDEFNAGLTLIIGYAFAWIGVFWFISVYWWMMLLNFGFELSFWVGKQVIRIFGWIVRLFS